MKNKKTPLVSVIMPAYNAEDYIVEAIESILRQSYKNFELIIIDDASTDSTTDIIRSYEKSYKQIKAIYRKSNLNGGGDRCANEGVKIAKGKYIARMDADDIARSDRLQRQVTFMEKHPEITLVGSNANVINKQGNRIGIKHEPAEHSDIYKSYMTFHPIIHPSAMIRRIAKGKKFSYRLAYSANNDYYTFFTLICQGHKFANIQDALIDFRIHGKNDTFVNMKKKFANTFDIRMKMISQEKYEPTITGLIATIMQYFVIKVVPEKTLTTLYMFAKGIQKPNISLPTLPKVQLRFAQK